MAKLTQQPKKKEEPKAPIVTPVPEQKALVVAPRPGPIALVPETEDLLGQDLRSGMEEMTKDSFAIPRVILLHPLSPQVQIGPGKLDGAEAGMFYESLSGTLWDGQTGFTFIPISYRFTHINWWPRNCQLGKGFISDLGPDPAPLLCTRKNEKHANMVFANNKGLPVGSEIVPTAEYFGMILDEETGDLMRVLVSMAKTGLKKSRKLNTQTQIPVTVNGKSDVAPLFYMSYTITSCMDASSTGQAYLNWETARYKALLERAKTHMIPVPEVLANGDDIYREARSFRAAVAKGDVKVQAHVQDDHVPDAKTASDDAPM